MRSAFFILIAAVIGFAAEIAGRPVAPIADEWRTRENLVLRLGSEWTAVNSLKRDLTSVQEMLAEIRSLELYPADLLGLSDAQLVAFDKSIEKTEKIHKQLSDQLTGLTLPLGDAAAIVREMVADKPVPEMFTALEAGNLERIDQLLKVKHEIDSLWGSTDQLLKDAVRTVKMPVSERVSDQDELFMVLRNSLGLRSQEIAARISDVKDSLTRRASRAQIDELFAIEYNRLRETVESGSYGAARERSTRLIKRFASLCAIDDLQYLMARTLCHVGSFEEALVEIGRIGPVIKYALPKTQLQVQCWYGLGHYDSVWNWAQNFNFTMVQGQDRNLLIWLSLQSGIHTGHTENQGRLASLMVAEASYAGHVLSALGAGFVLAQDVTTALRVYERALRMKPARDQDKWVQDQIRLSLAQAWFEKGDYGRALDLFVGCANNSELFDEALFGVSWCYVKQGQFGKAESSLRTLINQAPFSPRAVEGIILLARRQLSRAEFEWKRTQAYTREERRAQDIIAKLAAKAKNDTAHAANVLPAQEKAVAIHAALIKRSRLAGPEIEKLFGEAQGACRIVSRFYRTGTFQLKTFTDKREKLLHGLDSLITAIGRDKPVLAGAAFDAAVDSRRISKVKEQVRAAEVLSFSCIIQENRWRREWLDSRKEEVNAAMVFADSTQRRILLMRRDSLAMTSEKLDSTGYAFARIQGNALLAQRLNPQDEAYVRYHLGELLYIQENVAYRNDMARFEIELPIFDSLLARFRQGLTDSVPLKPDRPVLAHKESMRQYTAVISKFDEIDVSPAARYSLAWCLSDAGRAEEAVAHMETLATQYPTNMYTPQAWMFIGENSFDKGKLARATECYQMVMKYPESAWFDKALYKYAWTQYRMSNPEKAISSFLALVELGDRDPLSKSMLSKESMEYVAISFSESDMTGEKGLSRAARFVEKFGDVDRGTQILRRLASVYRDQGRFDMAEKSYRKLLALFPNAQAAPTVERELITTLDKTVSPAEANRLRVEYYKKYHRKGSWVRAQNDPVVLAGADSLSAQSLYEGALGYHQMALTQSDTALYTLSAANYEEFIRSYPRSPVANECHYNFAEIMFSLGDYFRATEEYIAVSRRYPDSKYRETAAWNAIVASQNLLKKERATP